MSDIDKAADLLDEMFDETGWYGWQVQLPAPPGTPGYHGNPRIWKLEPLGDWYGDTLIEKQAELVPVGTIAVTEFRSPIEAKTIVAGNAALLVLRECLALVQAGAPEEAWHRDMVRALLSAVEAPASTEPASHVTDRSES